MHTLKSSLWQRGGKHKKEARRGSERQHLKWGTLVAWTQGTKEGIWERVRRQMRGNMVRWIWEKKVNVLEGRVRHWDYKWGLNCRGMQ
jgi:hypothetical protein